MPIRRAPPSSSTIMRDQSLAGRARILSMPMKYSICAGPENFEAHAAAAPRPGDEPLVWRCWCRALRRFVAIGPALWPWRLGDEVGWAIVWRAARAARHARRAGRRRARPERRGAAGLAAQSAGRAGRDRCLGLRELRRGLRLLQRAGGGLHARAAAGRHRRRGGRGRAADVGGARRHGHGVAAADGRGDQRHRRAR